MTTVEQHKIYIQFIAIFITFLLHLIQDRHDNDIMIFFSSPLEIKEMAEHSPPMSHSVRQTLRNESVAHQLTGASFHTPKRKDLYTSQPPETSSRPSMAQKLLQREKSNGP